jgi:signal transduction histidine kinase
VLEASIGRLRTIAEVMVRGAERTAGIMQDLRVVSRVGETTSLPVDLPESIDVSLRLLRPRWADRIAVHKEYGAVPAIEGSATRVGQVLMNLLANAFDAIDGPGNVWIRTREEDGQVVVTVRDDGCGIAPEHVGRVFDPFFTTKPAGKGAGLGLSISAGIVRDHGGRLSVTSEAGTGSVFTMTLPARRPVVSPPSRGDP